ncbi:hypothetical protein [Actinocrispum sp. NPDC049592]|uniref:hypothetical protein n=1 Tax=Actinocrispum sp. NPDC049592 TaxID=3154835 RepID=UPI00341D8332
MDKRLGMLISAVLVAGVAAATPAQAAGCTWTVEKVRTPAGYEDQRTRVEGTDSHGNYSGTTSSPASDSAKVVIWNQGEPHLADAFADFMFPNVTDENSAGTVLVSGSQRSTGRYGIFLYQNAHTANPTLTYVPAPAGYETDYAVALNERGDVLGIAHAKDGHQVTVLWSNLAAGPIVIDTPLGTGIDLDDDGTVLLYDGRSNPAHVWRHGQITPLTGAAGPFVFGAIRSGKVIGYEVTSWPDAQSLLWYDPASPKAIEDGGTAQAINGRGLIVGSRGTLAGPAAVWRDTTLLAELPLPAGESDDDTFVVGDDDSIFGRVSGGGPLRWTCS